MAHNFMAATSASCSTLNKGMAVPLSRRHHGHVRRGLVRALRWGFRAFRFRSPLPRVPTVSFFLTAALGHGGVASIRRGTASVAGSSLGEGLGMAEITPEYRDLLRKGFQAGPSNMVFHIGFYLMWFGVAEMMLTQALAAVLGMTDHEKFDLLVRGMDLRVKVERLQKAAKKYNRPIGPNLKKRLDIITKKHVPLRNSIAHSWPHHDTKEDGLVHFASIGAMPPGILSDLSFHPSKSAPPSMHVDEIFDRALWLQVFT